MQGSMIAITVYFDNASTTAVREEVKSVLLETMTTTYGNPSSTHTLGRQAKAALDSARWQLADPLQVDPEELTFTSGGTEADNWAILSGAALKSRQGKHIITTRIEHDAVRKPISQLESQGYEVTWLSPDTQGRITAEAFGAALREDTVLASVMLVNNETGALNQIAHMAAEVRRRGLGTLLHTDAVQAFCKVPFTAKALGADLISLSAHKIHGPKGIGALWAKKGLKLPPLLYGGSQERERRPGTEALPLIAGLAKAAVLGTRELKENAAHVRSVYDATVAQLREQLPECLILSPGDSPYILSLALPGYRSEVLMNFLEAEGIYVAKSSACKKGGRSHVLEAMKLPPKVIDGALRVSFSQFSTLEEAAYFTDTLKAAAQRLQKRG